MIDTTLFHGPSVRAQAGYVIAGAAQVTAALRRRVRRAGLALWRGLEAQGRARALRELSAIAERCTDSDPQLARQLREACRSLARR